MAVVGTFPDDLVIAVKYDATGLATAAMADYQVVGWRVDELRAGWGFDPFRNKWTWVIVPQGNSQPQPEVLGEAPHTPPKTDPVVSPSWVRVGGTAVASPEYRGLLADFFTFLATNNDAHRLLSGSFLHSNIQNAWVQWKQHNGDLVDPNG